jgi:hypothetical protein
MKILSICVLIVLVTTTTHAVAGAYTCSGKIDGINQPYNGDVSVVSAALFGGSVGGRTICNISQPYTKGAQTVSPETCRAWLAKLLSAQARQTPLVFQYNDNLNSCAEQPMWTGSSIPWAMWE